MASPTLSIIAGTNHADSNTLRVAHHYAHLLQAAGISPFVYNLQDLPADFLATDLYGKRSDAFRPIEAQMKATHTFLFIVPEYNGSYPGVLKLFIDSMKPSEVFHGKRAALVGLSTGRFGNLRGLEHFAGVLNYVQVNVLPYRAHLMYIDKRRTGDTITDAETLQEIDRQLAKLIPFVLQSV